MSKTLNSFMNITTSMKNWNAKINPKLKPKTPESVEAEVKKHNTSEVMYRVRGQNTSLQSKQTLNTMVSLTIEFITHHLILLAGKYDLGKCFKTNSLYIREHCGSKSLILIVESNLVGKVYQASGDRHFAPFHNHTAVTRNLRTEVLHPRQFRITKLHS
jgi:hypothetical protein